MEVKILKVKKGRDWSIRQGHPWLFSGALNFPPSGFEPGELVDLQDAEGEFLARGYYNPRTDIAVRVLTRDPEEKINRAFFKGRVQSAFNLRQFVIEPSRTNIFRLINAEGDLLPGLIVDFFAGTLVVQSHTAGIDRLLDPLIEALEEVIKPEGILLRNDVQVRTREGLAKEPPRLLIGSVPGEVIVRENNFSFATDLWKGQKTGFFTDQRDKRAALGQYAPGFSNLVGAGGKPQLLNCFSYTAGFSVYSAAANPAIETINVDQSGSALVAARRNFELNNLDPGGHQFIEMEAFKFLEKAGAEEKSYQGVILDPPAFAKSHREKERALKGYIRLNGLGLKLVAPGGLLITCSCSGSVSLEEFESSVREAAAREKREIQVIETFINAPDHPYNLAAPEGRYLKVLFCKVK